VEYRLKREHLTKKLGKRRDKFIPDPILVKSGMPFVTAAEYKRTGFDRGHLAPAADFSFSQAANDETFVFSNIAPQTKLLNRGAWLRLEQQVRRWACGEGEVTIITGPVITASDQHLPSGLMIPQSFFKIIIDETPPKKTIAYIHHQNDPKNSMKDREVDPAVVERLTGITFPRRFPPVGPGWKSEDCQPKQYR
jgi:endonuclease G